MADETTIKWLYPPDFIGQYDSTIKNGHRKYVIGCTCVSDGTGETDSVKARRTDLLTTNGETPKKLIVETIRYNVYGMKVTISFNNDTDEKIAVLYNGDGFIDFRPYGGFAPIVEETGEDNLGNDIVFTTDSVDSGDTYDIEIAFRAK